MVFSSNIFLFFFLPTTLLVYYLLPQRLRNGFLLIASLLFYGWGEPRYLLLMTAVILMNYIAGLVIGNDRRNSGKKRTALIIMIILNLSLLSFFKYAGFSVSSLNDLLPGHLRLKVPSIALPLGISFYIFQSMSYVIDVYRGETAAQQNPVKFAAYVAMFPQLIAGPIVQYKDIQGQLSSRTYSISQFSSGVRIFILGLSKKLLLANKMGLLRESMLVTGGTAAAWFCMFAYSLQIYFDFSGYSDMAIGLGRMLGFEFLPNFRFPYISQSITEFWRRWHISLGSWFRDYVYIPLGGNHAGLSKQIRNILIVWALTGLWHGASWNFVLWGLYYGVLLILEKLFLLRYMEKTPRALRTIGVFLFVSLGWVLFAFTDFGELSAFVSRLFVYVPASEHELHLMLAWLPLLGLCLICSSRLPARLYRRLRSPFPRNCVQISGMVILLLLCVSSLAGESYNPFIYFRF